MADASDPIPELRIVEDHLRTVGSTYLDAPPGSRVGLSLTGHEVRPASRIYRFELTASGRRLDVIAKVPLARASPAPVAASERPRLVNVVAAHQKAALEFATLRNVAQTFGRLDDDRFGWVRPLAHIEEAGALLLVAEPVHDLRSLIRWGYLLRPSSRRNALTALARAGAWLRTFHDINLPHARERHVNRDSVADLLRQMADYLGARVTHVPGAADVLMRASDAARAVLPEALALGLGHGDLAPRNILVRTDGRVMMIDSLGRWRTCVLEDLGYALVAMKASPALVTLVPRPMLAWPSRCGEELLRGYFGAQQIPRASIAVYQLVVLGDRWAATVERRMMRGGRDRHRQGWMDRGYLRYARSCLSEAESDLRTLTRLT